jgi:hypothetical protein
MRIFDFFTKRKQKHSVSVDAVKEQNNVLLERLEKVESELLEMKVDYKSADSQVAEGKSATTKAKDRYEERQQQMLRPIHDMAAFVIENFEFRHNIVRDLYEYRRKGSDNPWKLIDKRQLNSINCRIQDEGEIFVLSSYVKQRIASFVGTTNERHVLTDRTGSRRFLILEPDGIIHVEGINHDQLYAQVLHEIEDEKLPHWFSKDDEAEMEKHNKDYYVLTDVERLFLRYFSIPEREGEGAFMSGPEIMQELEKHSQKTMAGVTANAFGRSMTRLGLRRVGHHDTDGYWVLAA